MSKKIDKETIKEISNSFVDIGLVKSIKYDEQSNFYTLLIELDDAYHTVLKISSVTPFTADLTFDKQVIRNERVSVFDY